MALRAEEERLARGLLAELERPVVLELTLGPGEPAPAGAGDLDFGGEALRVVEALAALSPLLSVSVLEQPGPGRFPAIAILPEGRDAGLRYYGLPYGYELASLLGACADAGRAASALAPATLAALGRLPACSLEVVVTPTCPHCPPVVLLAYRLALASPGIRAAAVEATAFPSWLERHGIRSVPTVVVDGEQVWSGGVSEREFVARLAARADGIL